MIKIRLQVYLSRDVISFATTEEQIWANSFILEGDVMALKRKLSWFVDKLLNLFLIGCGLVALWVLLQVTCIATFRIPSDSMEPALLPGDNILVNKWVMGARIFNIWDAAEGKEDFPLAGVRRD